MDKLREEIAGFRSLKRLRFRKDGSVVFNLKDVTDEIIALIDREKKAAVEEYVQTAKDHYWDSLEPEKEMILLHLMSLQAMAHVVPPAP